MINRWKVRWSSHASEGVNEFRSLSKVRHPAYEQLAISFNHSFKFFEISQTTSSRLGNAFSITAIFRTSCNETIWLSYATHRYLFYRRWPMEQGFHEQYFVPNAKSDLNSGNLCDQIVRWQVHDSTGLRVNQAFMICREHASLRITRLPHMN